MTVQQLREILLKIEDADTEIALCFVEDGRKMCFVEPHELTKETLQSVASTLGASPSHTWYVLH